LGTLYGLSGDACPEKQEVASDNNHPDASRCCPDIVLPGGVVAGVAETPAEPRQKNHDGRLEDPSSCDCVFPAPHFQGSHHVCPEVADE